MEMNLGQFLNEYTSVIPDSIINGKIFKITHSEKFDSITISADFEHVVPFKDIVDFEKELRLAIKTESVRLKCRYSPELFSVSELPNLINILKRDISVLNGFLDGAEFSVNGDILNIRLMHGGLDILNDFHVSSELSNFIFNQFGVKLETVFDENNYNSEKEYEILSCKLESENPPVETEPKRDTENISEFINSDSVCSLSPELGFDSQSGELITGKPIHQKPSAINEAMKNLGEKVTVIGDVFKLDKKDVKGDRTVIAWTVTDYSGSLIVKLFSGKDKLAGIPVDSIKKGDTILVSGKIDFDKFAHDITVMADSVIKVKRIPKNDKYSRKRV